MTRKHLADLRRPEQPNKTCTLRHCKSCSAAPALQRPILSIHCPRVAPKRTKIHMSRTPLNWMSSFLRGQIYQSLTRQGSPRSASYDGHFYTEQLRT